MSWSGPSGEPERLARAESAELAYGVSASSSGEEAEAAARGGASAAELFDTRRRHSVAAECLEPYRYLCASPGKNVRSLLIDCFQEWLEVPADKEAAIKQVVGFLHNASLLVDDIEDGSKLRRGQPVAHLVFGVPQTLNCANYIYFLAMEKCLSLQSAAALQIFTEELLNLHRGQGRELFWRDGSSTCPSEEDYVAMVQDKTGGLFRLGVGLLQCFSARQPRRDFSRLVNLLAVYFQVRDDLINLASKSYQVNKSFCEDLTEGKFSFPVIHGIRTSPFGDTRVLAILKQRTDNHDLKLSVVRFLRTETRSFSYTVDYLDCVFAQIQAEVDALGGSARLMALMAGLKREVQECEL
jgi:geranylgeranyl diphosphate synthase type 3